MADQTFKVCDKCQEVATPKSGIEVYEYYVEGPEDKVRVQLCDPDRTPLEELLGYGHKIKPRQTFARSRVASVDDIPRTGN
jgi:hypothetical protein